MSKPDRCELTTKDYSILEAVLEQSTLHDEAYRRLLRGKLSAARIVFPDAVAPQVATINSRVDFTIDGGRADNRILIHGKDNAFPGLTLPITTLRGLALLGLVAGETVTVERSDGQQEELRLNEVSHQPEASKAGFYRPSPTETETVPEEGSSVVLFSSRRKQAVAGGPMPWRRDDDDPGPNAA